MNDLKINARNLRKNSTQAENKIWYAIKNRQLDHKFVRQQVINNKYIVDFICKEKKLIIEIDGWQHCESDSDKKRDFYLQQCGYKVLRLWNNEVLKNLEGCLEIIKQALEEE